MFYLGNHISQEIKEFRKKRKLTKIELAKLVGLSVKTIYQLETGKRKGKIETLVKIRYVLKKNFNVDLFEKARIKIVWKLEDLNQQTLSIIEGGLLGDGSIAKYGIFQQTAKDKKYLEWLGRLLDKVGIKYKIVSTKSKSSYSESKKPFYSLYTHSCPAFFELRKRWYIDKNKGKGIKRVPSDIELTPTMLFHWYLGDGNLKSDNRKFPKGGRPSLRLFTNDFLREDIALLLERLKKDLGLNFYTFPKLSENRERGYILYLYPNYLFNFFKMIMLKPPTEIENSLTKEFLRGKMKGKTSTFREKWPNKNGWIKILAKTRGIGRVLREKRKEMDLTQREIAEKVGVKKHHISEIECGRKLMSLKCFTKILDIFKLNVEAMPEVIKF